MTRFINCAGGCQGISEYKLEGDKSTGCCYSKYMTIKQTTPSDPIPEEFNDLRDLLIDCYNLASGIPDMIDAYNENHLQVITSILLIKTVNTARALLLLIENNLLSEVHVLLRHQIEAVFVLKACKEDKAFLKEYINSDLKRRLRLGNVIANNPKDFHKNELFDSDEFKNSRTDLKSIVDEHGIKEIKVNELARKAGMESTYNTAY